MRHFDDVLQLPRLLLHLRGQEEGRQCDGVPVEVVVRVEHVEPVRVDDGSVDAQLRPAVDSSNDTGWHGNKVAGDGAQLIFVVHIIF